MTKLRQRTRLRNPTSSSSTPFSNSSHHRSKKRSSLVLSISIFALVILMGYLYTSYSYLNLSSTSTEEGSETTNDAKSQLRNSNANNIQKRNNRRMKKYSKSKPNPPDISPPYTHKKKHKSILDNVGDKLQNILADDDKNDDDKPSSSYQQIRKQYHENQFPHHPHYKDDNNYSLAAKEKLYNYVHSIRKPTFDLHPNALASLQYDVNDCPFDPPEGYPLEWNLVQILHDWKPNNTTFASLKDRPKIYQGLCRFTFENDYEKALNYRMKELPFIMRDDPRILQVVERWNFPTYLPDILGHSNKYGTEYSTTNHLMFYRDRGGRYARQNQEWQPPMSEVEMTYKEWAEKASQSPDQMTPNHPHWYFRVNAKQPGHFLYSELPFFRPKENFYIVDTDDTRGINCRFGMEGNIAEAHFDASRNFVMLFGGERRYILSHPKNCPNMALYPRSHPSGRHSKLDWNDPDLEDEPDFVNAMANEVVMQAGDVLYLPTSWFHFIVSLDMNWQCNARSGVDSRNAPEIRKCGFGPGP